MPPSNGSSNVRIKYQSASNRDNNSPNHSANRERDKSEVMPEQFYKKRLTQECYKLFQAASSQDSQEQMQEALKKHPMGRVLQMVIKSQMPKIPDLLHKLDDNKKIQDFIGQAAQNIAEAYEADIAAPMEQKDGK